MSGDLGSLRDCIIIQMFMWYQFVYELLLYMYFVLLYNMQYGDLYIIKTVVNIGTEL